MTRHTVARFATAVLTFGLLLLFMSVVFYGGPITPAQALLFAAGLVFAYIVTRLTQTLLSANPEQRRHAARRLIVAAVVPALLLTPSVVDRTPSGMHGEIIIAGIVWAAVAMALTSFIAHRAVHGATIGANSGPGAPSAPSSRHTSHRQTRVTSTKHA